MRQKPAFYCLLFLIPVVFILVAYGGFAVYRTARLYSYIKSNQRGWKGRVFQFDTELGVAPIPNAHGIHLFPVGPDIPMRFDGNGFRAPLEEGDFPPNLHPLVLALGCSFTYGDAVYARDAYPYLVGKYLGGTAKNAGCCSCGLAQMLILAGRLIPELKPDYVIAQYSPWLVSRALSPFAPTYFGKSPSPYFVRDGGVTLHPPVFRTKMIELPFDEYRGSPLTVVDFLSFLWNTGLPLYIHDDCHLSCYLLERAVGVVPGPIADGGDVVRYAYGEMARVARENGALLVIVVLSRDDKPVEVPRYLLPPDSVIVNAHRTLLDNLPVINKETYRKYYAHWRGTPPRVVDNHPNETAHRIIAREIVSEIRASTQNHPGR